jgi:uncharacterized damage-inducible protein DinB
MAETRRISDLMTRVIEGDPWHAGNVMDLLADVTVAEAKARPVPGAPTIWELVLHMTGWANEVRARVEGRAAGTPAKGDWPAVGATTVARWSSAKEALALAYRQLDDVVGALPDRELNQPVLDRRNNALGTGLSRYLTIHGAIHHGVYHAGQIALLKRTLRSGS